MQTSTLASFPPAAAVAAGTDIDLALQALGGDAAAFESIVRRYNRLLFRTARGVVHDDGEAQDVVQETYLRAFVNLRTYRGDSNLGTWLARIAINVALSSQRKKGRFVHWQEEADAGEQDAEPSMTQYSSEDEAPHALAERGEMRALLQSCIAELPVMYRSVFMMRAVQEMSVEDTAYCLRLSEDVVKTRFLRARAKLREALAGRIEANAADTFAFAGERCDAVVAYVIAQLAQQGRIHLH